MEKNVNYIITERYIFEPKDMQLIWKDFFFVSFKAALDVEKKVAILLCNRLTLVMLGTGLIYQNGFMMAFKLHNYLFYEVKQRTIISKQTRKWTADCQQQQKKWNTAKTLIIALSQFPRAISATPQKPERIYTLVNGKMLTS